MKLFSYKIKWMICPEQLGAFSVGLLGHWLRFQGEMTQATSSHLVPPKEFRGFLTSTSSLPPRCRCPAESRVLPLPTEETCPLPLQTCPLPLQTEGGHPPPPHLRFKTIFHNDQKFIRALPSSKVDGFATQSQHVNLRTVAQPE